MPCFQTGISEDEVTVAPRQASGEEKEIHLLSSISMCKTASTSAAQIAKQTFQPATGNAAQVLKAHVCRP